MYLKKLMNYTYHHREGNIFQPIKSLKLKTVNILEIELNTNPATHEINRI